MPPEQVVYASDYPYGQYTPSLYIALRTAMLAGFDEEQLRLMLGGTAARLADGDAAARADEAARAARPTTSRCSSRGSTSTCRWRRRSLWTSQADTVGVLGLAINTCAERNGYADRSTASASCSRRRATCG